MVFSGTSLGLVDQLYQHNEALSGSINEVIQQLFCGDRSQSPRDQRFAASPTHPKAAPRISASPSPRPDPSKSLACSDYRGRATPDR
jgi:hypothetical protein